ncbi:hypothetical protein [Flammeovirga agarivorans]|uniref:Uncharacterized protein n=1 Tax=Flammeovirga agarivorans TaxID=2726742 RepID=A0A7X8SRB9_9BACT|nr:hypothetical protein [Flammeovirga agarivorans]NLR94853.1 hypothetical protein [Flammeovirga agarivorans]
MSGLPFPEKLVHANSDYPIISSEDVQGGYKSVFSTTERDNIPLQKRGYGVLISVKNADNTYTTFRYEGTDLSDDSWTNTENWTEVGKDTPGISSYNDLTDKPSIPSSTSELTNDAGFITEAFSGYFTTQHDGSSDYGFEITDSFLLGYSAKIIANAFNGATLSATDGVNEGIITGGAGTAYVGIKEVASGDPKYIEISATAMRVRDAQNNKGLEYDADYSAQYTDLSLVNKKFVKDDFLSLVNTLESEGVLNASQATNIKTALSI